MIIRFVETTILPDGTGLSSTEEFIVDTDKIQAFKDAGHQDRLDYVEHLIADAVRGVMSTSATRKYSFGDCLGWYDMILADSAEAVEHTMEIEI